MRTSQTSNGVLFMCLPLSLFFAKVRDLLAVEDSNVLSRQWEEYRRFMYLSGKPGSGKTAVLLKCARLEDASPVVLW